MHNGSFCKDALATVDIFNVEWCVRMIIFPTLKEVNGGSDLISLKSPWYCIWFEILGNSTNSPWFGIHYPDYIWIRQPILCWSGVLGVHPWDTAFLCLRNLSLSFGQACRGLLTRKLVLWWSCLVAGVESQHVTEPVPRAACSYVVYTKCHPTGNVSNCEGRIDFSY